MVDQFDGTQQYHAILAKLQSLGPVEPNANHVRSACPMHAGDSADSFVLFPSGVGYCHSACGGQKFSPRELAERLELNLPPSEGLIVDELLAAFALPPRIAIDFGLRDSKYAGKSKVLIPYLDEVGNEVRVRERLSLHGGARFRWSGSGGRTYLYGLNNLSEIRKVGRVLLVEGETDTWSCVAARIPALGVPGAGNWREEYRGLLDDLEVAVWREPGDSGRTFVESVGSDLPEARVLSHPEAKDPAELRMLLGDEAFRSEIERLWNQAPRVTELQAVEVEREIEELRPRTNDLLTDPGFFDRLEADFAVDGYVGDCAPVLAAYLAITSRVLRKPMNLMLTAQSGAGKNHAVITALKFFPDTAYSKVDAGSPGSFIYDTTPLKHRAFVLTEFDSAPQGDSAFASAMRTLFEEQQLVYQTTVELNGERVLRTIIREGPIAVITTAIKAPEIQSDTRLLPVPVNDSKEQVAAIARSHARSAAGATRPGASHDKYQAFQRLVELSGPYEVEIPFAEDLFDLMPNEVTGATRFNRDWPQLLTAIQAVAVVNQQRRETRNRVIVADWEDYEIARRAFTASFSAAAAQGLTDADREAFGVIAATRGITNQQLAEKLGVKPQTATYRWHRLRDAGYVANTAGRNKTALEVNGPLPEQIRLPKKEFSNTPPESDLNPRIEERSTVTTQPGFDDSNDFEGDHSTNSETDDSELEVNQPW